MLSQVHARLLAEAGFLSQWSFRISSASSTAAAKFFLIQAYFFVLSYPEGGRNFTIEVFQTMDVDSYYTHAIFPGFDNFVLIHLRPAVLLPTRTIMRECPSS